MSACAAVPGPAGESFGLTSIGSPPDDRDPNLGTNALFVRPPSIVYNLVLPDGSTLRCTGPSCKRR